MFFFAMNLYHIDVTAEHDGNGGMQMSVRERILVIRIAEAISKYPEIAEELGISAELLECRDDLMKGAVIYDQVHRRNRSGRHAGGNEFQERTDCLD